MSKNQVWSDEIAEVHKRRAWAEQLGGPEAVAKHQTAGRLTIRQRVSGLLDEGSFQEIGKLTGTAI